MITGEESLSLPRNPNRCDEAVVDSHDGIYLATAESLSREKSYRKVTGRYDMPPGAPWRNGKCAEYVYGSRVVHRCHAEVLWQTQYPILPSLAHSFGADPTCTNAGIPTKIENNEL